MKQKIISICVCIVFFLCLSFTYGEQYRAFHEEKQEQQISQDYSQELHTNFSFDILSEIPGDTLWYTPYKDLKNILAERIKNAQQRVYVNAYIFTETTLRDAVIYAHDTGIDVQVLLENNPYKAPYLNDAIYTAFSNAGVPIKWSDPLNYSLNHAKYIIIDDRAYISTGNFSYSLFTKNRDFIVEISDARIVKTLSEIFMRDFSHKKRSFFDSHLVVSPDGSRKKLTMLLQQAKNTLDIYFPYIADEAFQQELFLAAKRGVKIRFITDKSFYQDEENQKIIAQFKEYNIELRPINKYKLHAKSILADEEILYIGSINFSRYSFDENREIGILLKNTEIIREFLQVFQKDL